VVGFVGAGVVSEVEAAGVVSAGVSFFTSGVGVSTLAFLLQPAAKRIIVAEMIRIFFIE
jgi:hypothetical protein